MTLERYERKVLRRIYLTHPTIPLISVVLLFFGFGCLVVDQRPGGSVSGIVRLAVPRSESTSPSIELYGKELIYDNDSDVGKIRTRKFVFFKEKQSLGRLESNDVDSPIPPANDSGTNPPAAHTPNRHDSYQELPFVFYLPESLPPTLTCNLNGGTEYYIEYWLRIQVAGNHRIKRFFPRKEVAIVPPIQILPLSPSTIHQFVPVRPAGLKNRTKGWVGIAASIPKQRVKAGTILSVNLACRNYCRSGIDILVDVSLIQKVHLKNYKDAPGNTVLVLNRNVTLPGLVCESINAEPKFASMVTKRQQAINTINGSVDAPPDEELRPIEIAMQSETNRLELVIPPASDTEFHNRCCFSYNHEMIQISHFVRITIRPQKLDLENIVLHLPTQMLPLETIQSTTTTSLDGEDDWA